MSAILNDGEFVRPRDAHDGIHVARLAIEMSRHNGASIHRDGRLQFCRIHVERGRIDIDKYRPETQHVRNFRYDPKRQGGEHNFGFARQRESFKDVVKRHAAIRSSDGVPHAVVFSEAFFILLDRRPAEAFSAGERF